MLEIKNLKVSYGKKAVLDGVSLRIEEGKITALIGNNAAGKSTLLSCLTGQVKYSGCVLFKNKELSSLNSRERAKLISLLPQKLPCPDISGAHLVRLGRTPHLDLGRHFTEKDREECEKAVLLTGTADLLSKNVSTMSGGERQKIFLAMTLACGAPFIALDEPTSYMDARHEREFTDLLLKTVKENKKTALVVMHDLTRAVEIADSIAVLDGGKIIFHAESSEAKKSGIIESTFGVKAYHCGDTVIYR